MHPIHLADAWPTFDRALSKQVLLSPWQLKPKMKRRFWHPLRDFANNRGLAVVSLFHILDEVKPVFIAPSK